MIITLVWLSSCRIHSLIPSYIFAFPDFPLTLSSFNSLSLSKEENKTLIVIMIVSPKNRRSVEEVFRDYCGRHSAIVKALTTGHSLKTISFFFHFLLNYVFNCVFICCFLQISRDFTSFAILVRVHPHCSFIAPLLLSFCLSSLFSLFFCVYVKWFL